MPRIGGVVGEIGELGALAGLAEDGGLGVLHLADLIDQAQLLGLVRRIWAGLQGLLQRRGRLPAILRRRPNRRLVDRGHPRQLRLLMGRGEVVVEVGIDGGLVLVALLVVGLDAILFEQPLEEHLLGRQPHRLEGRPGLHPQLVGRSSDHVGRGHRSGRHEALAVGEHRLARGAEVLDRQADLVGFARRQAPLRQADQEPLHVGVGLGPAQALDDRHGGQRMLAEQRQGVLGVLIGQRLAQVEFQHAGGRHWLGRAEGRKDQHQGQADEEDHQPGHHAGHGQQELFHRIRLKLAETLQRTRPGSNAPLRATWGRGAAATGRARLRWAGREIGRSSRI